MALRGKKKTDFDQFFKNRHTKVCYKKQGVKKNNFIL